MHSEPQLRQRVMPVSITSALDTRLRKPGDQLLVTLLLLFGNGDGDTHTQSRFDTFDRADELYGLVQLKVCSEPRPDPERVAGFDEHAAGTDVASAGAKYGRAPLNLQT